MLARYVQSVACIFQNRLIFNTVKPEHVACGRPHLPAPPRGVAPPPRRPPCALVSSLRQRAPERPGAGPGLALASAGASSGEHLSSRRALPGGSLLPLSGVTNDVMATRVPKARLHLGGGPEALGPARPRRGNGGPAWADSEEQPPSSSPLAASLLPAPTQVKTSFWDTGGHHIICNTRKRY